MIKIFDELNVTYPYSIDFNEDTQKFEIEVLVTYRRLNEYINR